MYTINHDGNAYSIQNSGDLAEVPTPALIATYNELTGKTTQKFASRAKGIDQVAALIIDVDAAPAEAPVSPGTKGATRRNWDQKVEVMVEGNPFREHCLVWNRWENAKPQTGDTIGELGKRGLTGGDINWCLKKNNSMRIISDEG